LIEAVIRVESAYNPRAVSRKGARGLMQLMPDTAARFGVHDAFDPEQNVLGGARYLSVLLAQFEGDVALACAAYNAGEHTVRRYGGVPPYRETQRYVEKIQRLLDPEARASVSAPAPRPAAPRFFYTWRDARGILNVSQYPPPAGQKYERHRMR
jgi:soluble lytic murein transglycosylase-like protein